MSADDDSGKLPLVSADVLHALQADLEDAEAARRYLLNNLQMWDGRYTRLSAAINAGNKEAAMDAVLSVSTSARMVGALRLAQLAAGIQQYLVAGDIRGAASSLDELEACGRLTMEELQRRFVPPFDPEGTDGVRQNPQNLDRGPRAGGWLRHADSLLAVLNPLHRWEPRLN